MKMFEIGDEITFDGSVDKTKELVFMSIGGKAKTLVTHPYSHFRVIGRGTNFYWCEKIWESSDEEIPVYGMRVAIGMKEAISYEKGFAKKVPINISKSLRHTSRNIK